MVSVSKNIGLLREENPAGIHHIHTRQMILHGNFLCPQMLFDGLFDVCSAFHRGIVGNNNGFPAVNYPNSGNDPGRRVLVVHDVERGKRRQFKKRRVGINEFVNPFAGQQFASLFVPLHCLISTPVKGFC
jgi:hypothetical protein